MAINLKKPRTINKIELMVVEKYRDLGYDCLKRGWPDFCFYNGDDVVFVEVKRTTEKITPKQGLNSYQVKMIDILRKLGLDVRVEYVNPPDQYKNNQRSISNETNKIIREKRINDLDIKGDNWQNLGVEIFTLTEYQYRFTQQNHVIDYYPTSGKYHDITTNKHGQIPAYDFYKLFTIPVQS